MALKRCPGCGGQISPHTTTCPWCGRSVVGSVLVQMTIAAVLVVGVASFTGLVNWSRMLPHLSFSEPAPTSPTARSGPRRAEQGGRTVMDRIFEASPDSRARVERVSKMAASVATEGTGKGCGVVDSSKIRTLVRRYNGWNDRVLALVACGQVRRGFTADQARAALGDPVSVLPQTETGAEVWVYGDLKLTIRDGRVASVGR